MIRFTPAEVQAFMELSHDRSPLHHDREYARKSPFAEPVVYGVLAVVAGIGYWARGRQLRLTRVKAAFPKPLFMGRDYQLSLVEKAGEVRLKYLLGSFPQAEISFGFTGRDDAPPSTCEPAGPPLSVARRYVPHSVVPLPAPYAVDGRFHSSHSPIPLSQLSLLCWCSYFVGMECPGETALFRSLKIDFGRCDREVISFQSASANFDERFNLVTIRALESSGSKVELSAFVRPDPVHYPLSALRQVVTRSSEWAGRSALVSGSGRGFGSVLSRTLSLLGADVAVQTREETASGEPLPGRVLRLVGDLTSPRDCAAQAELLRAEWGGLDLCVLNATPRIYAAHFLEQTGQQWLDFLHRSLATSIELTRVMLPLLRPGGWLVAISSVYVSEPRPQLSHYLAAKAALEALLRGLAQEYPALRFLAARLPRMRTDQTNLPYDWESARSPVEVSLELLRRIATHSPDSPGNYVVFQLGGESGQQESNSGQLISPS